MRTTDQVNFIKSRISNPYSLNNFLSKDEIVCLIDTFESASEINSPYSTIVKKNTGPTTLDLFLYKDNNLVKSILKKVKEELKDIEITAAFFFKTDYPHIIHNDDTFELPEGVYKGITLPLKLYGNYFDYPKLCFFDQFYFHGPAKFFNGSTDIPTYYNKQIYDYKDVDNLTDREIPDELYKTYFTHLRKSWLKGLSFHSCLDWTPGNALIFDSTRLHCASDFRKLGVTEKLGISIFTKTV
jgi:hypothetical protein